MDTTDWSFALLAAVSCLVLLVLSLLFILKKWIHCVGLTSRIYDLDSTRFVDVTEAESDTATLFNPCEPVFIRSCKRAPNAGPAESSHKGTRHHLDLSISDSKDLVAARTTAIGYGAQASSTLRIISLNVFLRSWGISDKDGDWKHERLTLLITHILPHYDVIAFQECFGTFALHCSKIIRAAQAAGLHSWSTPQPPSFCSRHVMDNGLLLLSRWPISFSETHTFQSKNAIYSDQFAAKGFQVSTITCCDSHQIHIINSHIQSDYAISDPAANAMKLKQWSHIAKHVQEQKLVESGPVIILGDLNCNAIHWDDELQPHEDIGSELYEKMMNIFGLPESSDVIRTASHGRHPPTTYSTYERTTGEEVDTVYREANNAELCENNWICLPRSVDYILVQRSNVCELDILSAGIEKLETSDEDFPHMSDHFAATATIRFNWLCQ
jgi:endonuclease/exonuclease/phosphatase family metal-dependent hydrolase